MHGIGTILLLVVSNVFMTFAWYGHLKLQQMKLVTDNTPLYIVILISWFLALFEYACQVPANRMGFVGNGGAFTLMQLKVIQEVISITIFTLFTIVFFKGEALQWNHFVLFLSLLHKAPSLALFSCNGCATLGKGPKTE